MKKWYYLKNIKKKKKLGKGFLSNQVRPKMESLKWKTKLSFLAPFSQQRKARDNPLAFVCWVQVISLSTNI